MQPSTPNAPSPGNPEGMPQPVQVPAEAQPSVESQVAAPSYEQGPAPQEVDRPSGEGANQNQGMTLPPVAPAPSPVPASSSDDSSGDDNDDVAQRLNKVNAPQLANDVDVIEKEWVDKAKQIVTASSNDPHKQNHDVSLLKADYMRKRYGKDVKIPDEKAA